MSADGLGLAGSGGPAAAPPAAAAAAPAAAAADIRIQSLLNPPGEFLFCSAHGATVEWLTRFFVPPTRDQTATLLRYHDRLILWPHQVVPPGDYRILLSYPAQAEVSPPSPSAAGIAAPSNAPSSPAAPVPPIWSPPMATLADMQTPVSPAAAVGPPTLPPLPASWASSVDPSTGHCKHHRWSEEEEAYLLSLPANFSDWGGLSSGRFQSRVSPFAIRAKYARLHKAAAPEH
jgi:hypothetical protein